MHNPAAAACFLVLGILLHPASLSAEKPHGVTNDPAIRAAIARNYGTLPLSFESHNGREAGNVRFLSRGHGYTLFLNSAEAVLNLSPGLKARAGTTIRLKALGANPNPTITGVDELAGMSNYFIGTDPAKWRTNVSNYGKVKIEDVYPGIDLLYYGNQQQLEYDWIVKAGADPKLIRFAVECADDLRVDDGGELVLDELRGVHLKRPLTYQQRAGSRVEIASRYVLLEGRRVGFEVGEYDPSAPLIIDPVLSYSTYLGGSDFEGEGVGLAVDASGCVYIAAATLSPNFPLAGAFQASHRGNIDVVVTKLNSAGTALVFSTYLGGSARDYALTVAVDSSGHTYVAGWTGSTDFPTANPIQASNRGGNDDVFVTKLSPSGNGLVYSTYLGGTGDDEANGIAVDPSGCLYVTGSTSSSNFPTTNPFRGSNAGGGDAFVTKLNTSGNALVYSTYLGGSGSDSGRDIAVDPSGSACVVGETRSFDFPTANAFQASYRDGGSDVFFTRMSVSGNAVIYSTYLGGSGRDTGWGIALDSTGFPYIAGETTSTDFPMQNAVQASNGGNKDVFVTKLNTWWNALFYSTYLGGSGDDRGFRIAVDSAGNAYVTGITRSVNFPTVNSFQASLRGSDDAFVTALNSLGTALMYSSFLGGSGLDIGFGVAVDFSGSVYLAGGTASTDFPKANALQSSYGGGSADIFVTKIGETTVRVTVSTDPSVCSFVVDGTTYASAQNFSWPQGSNHTISALTPQDSGGTRRVFANWTDGGTATHVITATSSTTSYKASFTTQYRLTTSVSPADAGSVHASPTSADAYYPSGVQVQLRTSANPGYLFSSWGGDIAGTKTIETLVMTAPRSIAANFLRMPGMSVEAGGASKYQTPGTRPSFQVGYTIMGLLPGGVTPYGTAVFSFRQNGVTVSEAGVPASPPTTRARIFIDYRNRVNATPGRSEDGLIDVDTGIAVVNPDSSDADVTYTLRDRSGNTVTVGHGTVSAGRHFACFLRELKDRAPAPDFNLPADFATAHQFGSLEVSSSRALSVLGLRGTLNQRGEFLMTTTPVADMKKTPGSTPVYFPQFVDGGGYTTSLLLLNTSADTEIGTLQVLDDYGLPLVVKPVGGTADSSFRYEIPPGGIYRFQSEGSGTEEKRGWVRLSPAFNQTPVASGVFGYVLRQVLVSQSGIPAVVPTTRARVYVDLSGNHNTGLAIANVDSTEANIAIKAYQTNGATEVGISQGPLKLPAGGHDAKFANQFVSGLPAGFTGVLDISSATPFAALTIRSLDNERGDFLMTTFPVADANATAPWPYFPQVVDEGGYVTELILLISPMPGWGAHTTLYFYSEDGSAWNIQP